MRAAVVLGVAGLVALGAACGGSDDSPQASTFRSSANRICARTFDVGALRDRPSEARLARAVTRWERGVDRLAALEPSAGEVVRFRTMLAHLRRMLRAVRASARAQDESVLPKLISGVVEGQRASKIARALDLDACAVAEPVRQPPRDPETLAEATRALVPRGVRVTRMLDCDDESCLLVLDVGGLDAVRAARAALGANGWAGIRSRRPSVGSDWVMAGRNDLLATFQFPARDQPPCDARRDAPFCADTLWVHRVRVPELFP